MGACCAARFARRYNIDMLTGLGLELRGQLLLMICAPLATVHLLGAILSAPTQATIEMELLLKASISSARCRLRSSMSSAKLAS